VKQRLQVAKAIRSLKEAGKTIIVAEHDLAIIDYLSIKSVSSTVKLVFMASSAMSTGLEQA
jgi:translation initiation factor RLI1